MRGIRIIRKVAYVLAAICLVVGLIPTTGVSSVYADDGGAPPAEENPAPESAPASEPAAAPAAEEEPVAAEETDAVDAPAVEGEAESDEAPLAEDAAAVPAAEPGNEVADLVQELNDEGIQLADENGNPLPLASVAAEEILAGNDPFVWNGTEWVGYTTTGTGCPANVTCIADANPFAKAVEVAGMAGSGKTIYVSSGTYDEDVVINTPNLSFIGFFAISVAGTNDPTAPTLDASGYAVVRSLTLNANFDFTSGVYADTVIVNGPLGGHLDDGLSLVNTGGTLEADVKIKSGGGDYIVEDAYFPGDPTYELECGDPHTPIYPGRQYRMVFKEYTNTDVEAFYTTHSPDQRTDIPGSLSGTPLSAADRLHDLLIGVNLAQANVWTHPDEKQIFWNLLGYKGGKDINGLDVLLKAGQQTTTNSVTDGTNDGIATPWSVWFMWPILEDGRTVVSPVTRQLTFIPFDPQINGCMDPQAANFNPRATINEDCYYLVYGCTDPNATNFNGQANTDDGSCTYPDDVSDPPTAPVVPGIPIALIPVTGAGGPTQDLLIIPVTGVDLAEKQTETVNRLFLGAGVIFLAAGILLKKKEDQISG